ncbi:hypothetical protein EAO70_36825, partial [Streptomyces sp. adm13(2018)]
EQVTFLGNHDMGRIGTFLQQDNPNASDTELVRRATLANELMFLSRGNPVIYYGDEQGFTGPGGDKDARQTLFASKTAEPTGTVTVFAVVALLVATRYSVRAFGSVREKA